jgi:hypothetical protein
MPGKDLLGDTDAKEAADAFRQEWQFWQEELDHLRYLPQAKLGRALMPPGSSRERLFQRLVRFKAAIRKHGFGGALRKANRRVLVKLHLRAPEVPRPEERQSLNAPGGTSDSRIRKIDAVLSQAREALPALQQYQASLNLSVATRKDKGPTYVEFSVPEIQDSRFKIQDPGYGIRDTGSNLKGSEIPSGELESPEPLVKLIAFYLPQFHPIPENDSEWGRGFTEWSNVTRAIPQYRGQYQPHLPEDLGFYDLRIKEVQERQVELAKNYGLYGFAMYYYWFAGKRVLDKPLDSFLENPNIDFPFCLIWANENWTRRWDGHEDDVFLAQVHTPESDVDFIRDAEKYLRHPNYIKVDGKPLLIVYKCQLLPNAAETVQRWRDYARTSGLGELYLVAAQTLGFTDPTPYGFDAAMQFPPHNEHMKPNVRLDFWTGDGPVVLNREFDGGIYTYPGIVQMKLENKPETSYKLYETAFPMWDNTARRPTSGWIYAYSSPELYRLWLTKLCNNALSCPNPSERLVFLNAWNEWAEGAHLEPDRRYGYAYLKATRDARAIAEREAGGFSIRNTLEIPMDQQLASLLGKEQASSGARSAEISTADKAEDSETDATKLASTGDRITHSTPRASSSEFVEATFVYQMGKVGSMSIVLELEERDLGHPVIHSHMLNEMERISENACRQYPNPTDVLYEAQRGKMIREWMSRAGSNAKWNVITLTREPVGRNISAFFQNIEQLLPNIEARLEIGDIFVDELHELFLRVFNSRAPEFWFDNQLKPVFGIDVYSEPYDFEKGYKIYSTRNPELGDRNLDSKVRIPDPRAEYSAPNALAPDTSLLLIRMEDLTRSIQPAMQAFLGLQDFPPRIENRTDQKYYSHVAPMFKQRPLPEWYVDAMYSTRYATHFYTPQELEKLREKWTGKTRLAGD